MKYQLNNEYLTATILDHGAELASIFDKQKKREVLWQADPAYWNRHAPILFPNVGKHFNNEYLYEGKIYQVSQHGFARDKEFSGRAQGRAEVVHTLKADGQTRAIFPFEFSLEVSHRLEANQLRVQWRVRNEGDNQMYFTIGGHPAFRVPVLEGTKQSDYQLLFKEQDQLEYKMLDQKTGTCYPAPVHQLKLEKGRCPITADMFDQDALIFDGGQIAWAAIGYPDGSPYVAVESAGFPNFGIWSKPGAPFVCLEPWIGRCDNIGFDEEISKKPGITKLEPGQEFLASYRIIVY